MKKGISLVVLVITIIVLVIITGTVVLTLVNNGIIEKGSNAVEEHNKREVYNAVQQEVLAVQQENIGLPMGTEFAQKLQVKLNTKYPNAGVIVAYNPETKKIDIEYTLNEKKYLLTLDEGYKLEFVETPQEPIPDPEPVYEYQEVQAVDPSLWTTIEDPDVPGEYIITKYTGTGDKLNNVTIPNKIGDKKISKVGNGTTYMAKFTGKLVVSNSLYISKRAFYNCYGITEIELEHSVQTFDATTTTYSSFYWSTSYDKLTSLNIGENCIIGTYTFANKKNISELEIKRNTTLNEASFYKCTGIKTLTLRKGIVINDSRTASVGIFSGCTGLETVNMTGRITNIGNYAFGDCTGLKIVNMVEGIENIGNYAFRGCTSLETVTIPSSVTNIGNYAFYNCTGLETVNMVEGIENIGNYAFGHCTSLNTVVLPKNTQTAGSYVFSGCDNIQNLTVANEKKINEYSSYMESYGIESSNIVNLYVHDDNPYYLSKEGIIYNKTGTEILFVPKGKTEINIDANSIMDMYVVFDCSKLARINVDPNNQNYYSDDGVLLNKEKTKIIVCPQSKVTYNMCNTINSMEINAFWSCKQLENLTISSNMTNISEMAFDFCVKLSNVTIPSGVTIIGSGAFHTCVGLEYIEIPEGVTHIGSTAFNICTGLTNIKIPSTLRYIGQYAFSGCTGLTNITLPDNMTRVESYAFTGVQQVTVTSGAVKQLVLDSGYTGTIVGP